ncbi:hypothetical protein NQ317_019377 [Molorchus minor]|uniref:Uncharacterized protein n=1 Tax=Molorchus minor TaxID=1323400 RepID=A0ABQ9JEI5_9CUCU|nr:hypothetical protein NQ317_019377 [Molorchus minor]
MTTVHSIQASVLVDNVLTLVLPLVFICRTNCTTNAPDTSSLNLSMPDTKYDGIVGGGDSLTSKDKNVKKGSYHADKSLVTLTVQNALLGLSMRYARTREGDMFLSSTDALVADKVWLLQNQGKQGSHQFPLKYLDIFILKKTTRHDRTFLVKIIWQCCAGLNLVQESNKNQTGKSSNII